MSTALSVLRQRLLRELDLGWNIVTADVASFTATGVVSTVMLQNTLWGPTYFSDQNCVIFRPGAATAADFIRIAGDFAGSTGTITIIGPNYADTTKGTEGFEIWKFGIRPTREIIDSLNRCLEFEFVTTKLALSHLSPYDGDMILSTETDWTEVGTTTTTKVTTDTTVPWGIRSYHITNTAAPSGVRSSAAGGLITQGKSFNAFTIARILTGVNTSVASLQGYDHTNSANIGTSVTTGEGATQLLSIKNQASPDTCKTVRLNLFGDTATSDVYFNQAWLYKLDELTVRLPSSVTEGFMAPRILQAVPRTSTGTDTYDATSFDFIPLVEGVDYWLQINYADGEPAKARFANASYFDWPLFVEARIPQSGLVTMAEDEAAVVSVPVHNLLPRWKIDVLDTILLGKIPNDKFTLYHEKAEKELIRATHSRPMESIAPAREWWAPRLGAG